jgi:hypothetical protein
MRASSESVWHSTVDDLRRVSRLSTNESRWPFLPMGVLLSTEAKGELWRSEDEGEHMQRRINLVKSSSCQRWNGTYFPILSSFRIHTPSNQTYSAISVLVPALP